MSNDIQIIDIDNNLTEQQAQDVLNFWQTHSVKFSEEEATKRLQQVAQLSYSASGELVGLYTCYIQVSPHIKREFFYIRAFVSPDHRMGHVSENMFTRLIARLEKDFVEGKQSRCIGVISALENKGMQQRFNQAVWDVVPFTYIGDNHLGNKVYVYYFPDARL